MLTGVDASGALIALLLNPQGQSLQQAALALLLTKPLLPSITAASTRAVSSSLLSYKTLHIACMPFIGDLALLDTRTNPGWRACDMIIELEQ